MPMQAWPVVALTPPPEELISATSVREARSRVQMVADRLALSGAAVVSTFVSVANGDIVIVDVNCVPDFVPGAPLLQQVEALLAPECTHGGPRRARLCVAMGTLRFLLTALGIRERHLRP